MRKKFHLFSEWISRNQKIICLIIIIFSLLRFLQLNYVNWEYGKLCTGTGGIQYAYDSARLMDGAQRLTDNEPLRRIQLPYSSYILLIAFFIKFNIGLESLLIIQLAFALLAAYALSDFCRIITNSRLAGVVAASFVLINPFIVQWHLFIHTDSIYSSCLIITLWLIYKAYKLNSRNYYFFAAPASLFTILLRPNGWLLIPAIAAFVIIASHLKKAYKISILLCPVLLLFIALNFPFFTKLLDDYYVFSYNREKVIIFKDPNYDLLNVSPRPNEGRNYLLGYNFSDPRPFFKRIAAELFPIYRPWTSLNYVLRFLIWMLPLYIFSFIGSLYLFRNRGILFIMITLCLHLFIIGITYANNEFRFMIQVLPLFVLLCSCGMHELWKKARTLLKTKT